MSGAADKKIKQAKAVAWAKAGKEDGAKGPGPNAFSTPELDVYSARTSASEAADAAEAAHRASLARAARPQAAPRQSVVESPRNPPPCGLQTDGKTASEVLDQARTRRHLSRPVQHHIKVAFFARLRPTCQILLCV